MRGAVGFGRTFQGLPLPESIGGARPGRAGVCVGREVPDLFVGRAPAKRSGDRALPSPSARGEGAFQDQGRRQGACGDGCLLARPRVPSRRT